MQADAAREKEENAEKLHKLEKEKLEREKAEGLRRFKVS